MIASVVLVRFFRSFNFDYLKKNHPKAVPQDWETFQGQWYPFIRVPLESDITTIVGANESGKSQLLDAIEVGLHQRERQRSDFCRYSKFYSVAAGEAWLPEVGFTFNFLTEAEKDEVGALVGTVVPADSISVVQNQENKLHVTWKADGDQDFSKLLDQKNSNKLKKLYPKSFRFKPELELPNSAPVYMLAGKGNGDAALPSRSAKREMASSFELIKGIPKQIPSDVKSDNQLSPLRKHVEFINDLVPATTQDASGIQLAKKLLVDVCGIDKSSFAELSEYIEAGQEGPAVGVTEQMNGHIARVLNLEKWWSQDKDFQLRVNARDTDLVFTIRDRTGTDYSFQERSGGLKHFLGFFTQFMSYGEGFDGSEILLLDEPDATLSSNAQRDLLRVFEYFVSRRDHRQLIYVTHSPFLIDRNHGERVRVVEKGFESEGTRVVKNVARNHYEPLRSAIGPFLGETAYIGNCNIFLEGMADQILIAGINAISVEMGASKLDRMDLNDVTLIPAGGSKHIPYLVYLARGRDVAQPPAVVLLDSDKAGLEARDDLAAWVKEKRVIKDRYIAEIKEVEGKGGQLTPGANSVEIEDLIPIPVAIDAVKLYYETFDGRSVVLTEDGVKNAVPDTGCLFKALCKVINATNPGLHLDKVGFARCVVDVVGAIGSGEERNQLDLIVSNFRSLIRLLEEKRRAAVHESGLERVIRRVNRTKAAFLQDYKGRARKEDAYLLVEKLLTQLDDTLESEQIRLSLTGLVRDHKLDSDQTTQIEDFEKFCKDLNAVELSGEYGSEES